MIEIRKTEVFVKWLDSLRDIRARARVLVRIERLASGNPGDVKPVAEGVSELRINYMMHSQKTLRWISKNFVLQGLVVFQG